MDFYGRRANLKNSIKAKFLLPAKNVVKKNVSTVADTVKKGIPGNVKTTAVLASSAAKMKTKQALSTISQKIVKKEHKMEEEVNNKQWYEEYVEDEKEYTSEQCECDRQTLEEGICKLEKDLNFGYHMTIEHNLEKAIQANAQRKNYERMYKEMKMKLASEYSNAKEQSSCYKRRAEYEEYKGKLLDAKQKELSAEVSDLHDQIDKELERHYEVFGKLLEQPKELLRESQRAGNFLITNDNLSFLTQKMRSADVFQARAESLKIQNLRKSIQSQLKQRKASPAETSAFFSPFFHYEDKQFPSAIMDIN